MKKPEKDRIYAQADGKPAPFRFDDKVAEVFPDMIQRSVPGYTTIIDTLSQFAARFVKANTQCYDLGCSLGAASLSMRKGITHENCKIVAVDNSPAMTERCQMHMAAFNFPTSVEVLCADVNDVEISNASMVVLNFTLQFLPPEKRRQLLKTICTGLNPGGLLILSEKILFEDETLNQTIVDMHHDFKRANGYSDLEISQKRTALENVLIPDTIATHQRRLRAAGFSSAEVWFQHFNFLSFAAIK